MLKEKADRLLSPVLGRFHELDISHGSGCYLYDKEQTAYLDFGSGIAVTSTGHCHPKIVAAIKKQSEQLIHPCIAVGNTDSVITCAEKLTDLLKPEPYSVFFDQSGSAAVEAAIKLAKKVSGRYKCIAFKGGFHGRSMGSLSLTSSKESYREGIGPLIEGISFFPYPYSYRCPFNETDTDCESASIQALTESPLFNSEVAAVIIEPVLGEGGYSAAPIKFLKALENKCKKHGILLIVDEIQSGIGRTGQWFSFQKAGLSPDIIVSAKGLGSGMPISACIAKKSLMDKWTVGSHGGTYGSNPICCAAAAVTIDIIRPLLPQVSQLSEITKKFLHKHLDNHKNVGDIRVEGLMIGLELVKDKTSKTPYPEMVSTLLKKALEKKLIILSCGIHSNVIRLAPPLIISEEELLKGLSILCKCIHDYH